MASHPGHVHIPHRRSRPLSLDVYMHTVKLPCDRRAAAEAARGAAARMRASALSAALFTLLFAAAAGYVFLSVAQAPLAGPPIPVLAVFLAIFALVVASILRLSLRATREAREVEDMASLIASGLMPEEEYCDKTLYEALAAYRSRRGPGPTRPQPPP